MYTIKKEILRLDLNEFNFDFDSGYIDGSDQWLNPNEERNINDFTTYKEASKELSNTVYVSLNNNDLTIIYEVLASGCVCISNFKYTEFEGARYKINDNLYCPELAQILKDRIYEIKKEQE